MFLDHTKQEKILKLLRTKYNEGKCVSAAVDQVNYEFDFNVIKEKEARKYLKNLELEVGINNQKPKIDKKRKVFFCKKTKSYKLYRLSLKTTHHM